MIQSSAPAINLVAITEGLDIVNRIKPTLSGASEAAEIDRFSIEGSAHVQDLRLDDLLLLKQLGHAVEVSISEGGWEAHIVFDGPADPTIEVTGPAQDAFTAEELAEVERGVTQRDVASIFRAAAALPTKVRVSLRNDTENSASHWILSVKDLIDRLSGSSWAAVVLMLDSPVRVISVSQPPTLPTQVTGQLLLRGIDEPYNVELLPVEPAPDIAYREAHSKDGRLMLPPPQMFWNPADVVLGDRLLKSDCDRVRAANGGVARRLAWHWLATHSSLSATGDLQVTISGARVVSLSIPPEPVRDASADLTLYQWATASDDPARRDSLEHALSLAVSSSSDVPTAAAPALRTARSLYELARRGAVAEALASRRAAREAVIGSAHDATDTARDAAGKSIERTLVQIGALVGVVITYLTNTVSRVTAITLLSILGVLALTFLLVTERFSLKSAETILTADLSDLDQYREALGTEDIAAIKDGMIVAATKSEISARGVWSE